MRNREKAETMNRIFRDFVHAEISLIKQIWLQNSLVPLLDRLHGSKLVRCNAILEELVWTLSWLAKCGTELVVLLKDGFWTVVNGVVEGPFGRPVGADGDEYSVAANLRISKANIQVIRRTADCVLGSTADPMRLAGFVSHEQDARSAWWDLIRLWFNEPRTWLEVLTIKTEGVIWSVDNSQFKGSIGVLELPHGGVAEVFVSGFACLVQPLHWFQDIFSKINRFPDAFQMFWHRWKVCVCSKRKKRHTCSIYTSY